MAAELELSFASPAELACYLQQHLRQDALFIQAATAPAALTQFAPLVLHLRVGQATKDIAAEVLQLIAGVGLVVAVAQTQALTALASGESTPEAPQAAPASMRGMGPLSWPIEKLRIAWNTLPFTDQVRVARYGSRQARGFVLQAGDRTLHPHLLANSRISASEIATLAGNAATDPKILERILANRDWLRDTAIVRNLICNPKLPLPKVQKLIDLLPVDELLRLTKTGRVRAAVKRDIIRRIEQRQGRR